LSDIWIMFAIIVAIVVLFAWDRVPVVIVALGTALALYATGVLNLGQALAGLGDPAVIFIASLFVVSAGLDATGVTAWAGQFLIARAGNSRTRLMVVMLLLIAVLTALISVNGAVAALLPVVVVTAIRLGRPTSQLLMPLVFGSHAGSMLALTGTPVNVLVSEAAQNAGLAPFGYFEFTIIGIPLLTIAIIVLFGQRLLPDRNGRTIPSDLSRHARTLVEQYSLDDALFQLRVRDSSPFVGMAQSAIGLAEYPGVSIVAVRGKDAAGPLQRATLAAGDTLVVRGEAAVVASLAANQHLAFRSEEAEGGVTDALFNRTFGLAEVMIPPRSEFVGQAVAMGAGAKQAIGVLAAMVLLLATGLLPAVVVGLLAACAMVVLGLVRVEEAYRSINWTTVILVGAMTPLSTAMAQTGAAQMLADGLVRLVGDAGPYALLAGLFLLTAVLGQLISNTATALIIIPIAVAAAADLHISARPVLMSVTVAAAGAFLTPVATPVNLMVMGPGGYRFGDYWKLGLPLLIWFGIVATFGVPIVWSFR
jgi:di/tricarboxylate transporter